MTRVTSAHAVVSIHLATAPDAAALNKCCEDDLSPAHDKQLARARRRQQVEAMHAQPPPPRRQTASSVPNAGAWRRSSSMPSHRRPVSLGPGGSKPPKRVTMPHTAYESRGPASQAHSSAAASQCSTPCSAVKSSAFMADLQTIPGDSSCGVYSHAVQLQSHASQLTDTAETMEVLSVMDAQELLPRLTNLRVTQAPDALQTTSDSGDGAMAPRGVHQKALNDFLSTQHNSSTSSPCVMLPGQPSAPQAPPAPFFEPEDDDRDNTAQCAPCGMLQEWLQGSDCKEQLQRESSARSLVPRPGPGSENSAAMDCRILASTGNLTDRCLQSPQLPATPHSRTSPLGVSSIVGSPHTHFPSMAQSHLQRGPLSPIEGTCMSSAALYATDSSAPSEAEVDESCSGSTPKELVRNNGGSSCMSDTTVLSSEAANISQYPHVSIPPFKQADDIMCSGGGSRVSLDALAADLAGKSAHGAHASAQTAQKDNLAGLHNQGEAGAQLRSPTNTDCSSSTEVECTHVSARHVFAPLSREPAECAGEHEGTGHIVEQMADVDTMPAWETAYSTATWEKPPNELTKNASDSTVHSDIDQVAASRFGTERQDAVMKGRFQRIVSLLLCAQSCACVPVQ